MDYYSIGQRIRKYRKANRLSQEQLAEQVGISVTHMSHIETGNTKLSLPVLVKISNTLGVQTDDLLSDQLYSRRSSLNEISDIFVACSPEQLRIIIDVIKTLKISLDKFDNDRIL